MNIDSILASSPAISGIIWARRVWNTGLELVIGGLLQARETTEFYRRALVFKYEAALYQFKSNFAHDTASYFCRDKNTLDCSARKKEFVSAITTEAEAEDAVERSINVLIDDGNLEGSQRLYKEAENLHRTALERLFVAAKLECE